MTASPLRSLLDHAPGLLCALDEQHRCRFLNAQGARWLGLPPAAAQDRPLASLVDPVAWISIRGHLDVARHESQVTFEHELVFAHEGTRRVRTTLGCTSATPGVLLAMEDIHEQLELEQRLVSNADELERSNAAFRTLIEQSPDGVFVHQEGRVVYVNPARVRMMGYERAEELIGRRTEELVHPEDRPGVESHIAGISAGTEPPQHRIGRLLRKDGSALDVEVLALPIVFEGRPALLSSARDLTERRQLIARMMEMDRMITAGTLAAGVGHEINNPLAYLLGNLEFALEGLAEVDPRATAPGFPTIVEITEALQAARDGALRIKQVTRDLRSLSRTEERPPTPVDLRQAIESAIHMVNHEVQHRATLTLDLQPIPPVLGDDTRLGQVMINLLVNAAHAIDEGDTEGNEIRVSTRYEPDSAQVIVEVRDTGCGIPHSVREHLFDPFVTTKPLSQGTGLGLAICRQIVDAHRGTLSFETELNRGTTFRVALPPATHPVPAAAPSPAPVRARARVLILDDDPLLVAAFFRVLRREHDVVTFTRSQDALDHLATAEAYDVILCDLMMPELSGIEVFERVTHADPDTADAFLFMTGGAFTPRAQQFIDQHRAQTLDKPIAAQRLRQAVARRATRRRSGSA